MPPGPADLSGFSDIYVDESSQTKHRFMLLGGIVVPTQSVQRFEAAVMTARRPELPFGEMAWTKVSNSKLPAYQRVMDAVLGDRSMPVEFHSLIVDTHKIRDSIFNKGSRDAGFNKEIYQLLMKFWRMNKSHNFHAYLDRRNTASSPNELRDIVNQGIRKKVLDADWPFRRIHFRDSHDCLPIQVVDVMLGAIGYHINGHRSDYNASKAKSALSDHILRLGNVRNPTKDTNVTGRFTIWHRRLR